MIRNLLDILLLSAGAVLAGLMLLAIFGLYSPVFDRFMAAGVLSVALGAMFTALNSLAGRE